MTLFRGPRPTETPWFERDVSPLAKKLITVDDAPKGLSEAERLIYVDVFNSIFVLPGATEKQAKAAAEAFLEQSDVDEDVLEKYDDQDD